MEFSINQQYYTAKDMLMLFKSEPRLTNLHDGDNQNACCGGGADEKSSGCSYLTECPPHMLLPPVGGLDKRTKIRLDIETAEARKVRLTTGQKCKTLLDDAFPEPLPPMLRRPGEAKQRTREAPKARIKSITMPVKDAKYHEKLDKYLNHLPFFGLGKYNRVKILKRLTTVKPLRGILKFGRYYIERDWKNKLDPRMDPDTLIKLERVDERRRRRLKAGGAVNRIVELFMDKVLSWNTSRDMMGKDTSIRSSTLALLWLGPSLAKKMMNELCLIKETSNIFESCKRIVAEKDFFLINRLPVDVFFADKETFFFMLKDYILSPTLICKAPATDCHRCGDGSSKTCHDFEALGVLTRRVCAHQNLSLSLKPCLVPNCRNYKKPVCEHMYAFIPETISISSYMSMLYFADRFERVEDLKGCVFITKPAYLCNGRGINFLFEKAQFEYFYHMMDGKTTSRHGVVLQRYIENPRLFDKQKFTIRFFLLIVVLPKRRVLGFIHYGLAIFCPLPYKPVLRQEYPPDEEILEGKMPDYNIPITCRTIGRVVDRKLNRFVHLSNYYEPQFRIKLAEDIRTGQAEMLHEDEDNVFYLHDILPTKCPNSTSIYIQMLFASQCIMDYMQPVIHDYAGTFQTISIDSLVDARNKLWVLEAGTKIFSGLLKIAPRQRYIMSAVIQESLGVTIECFYKSFNGLPLYRNYETSSDDYDAFYFAQDFNFFYETDITKQTDFVFHRWQAEQQLRLEQRFYEVDISRDRAKRRKRENEINRKKVVQDRLEYLAKVKLKDEEES